MAKSQKAQEVAEEVGENPSSPHLLCISLGNSLGILHSTANENNFLRI
jgi:hypothetical protein